MKRPHQSSLREGRFSAPHAWYSVTTCIKDRHPLLVPDPLNPLVDIRPATIIKETIRWLHRESRWQCKAFVVMPDHVHIILALGQKANLSNVMNSFGKHTASRLNELLNRKGQIWQKGFYDHCLRKEESYLRHLGYIRENPVRKGFVDKPEDWPFSAIEPAW